MQTQTTIAHLNMALVKLFTVRELRIKPMCSRYYAMWLQQGTDNVTSVSWQWISAVSLPPQSSVCTVSAPDRQLQRAVFEIFPNTVIFLLHREHGTWNVSDNNWMSSRGLSRKHWQRSYLKLSVESIESKLHGPVMRNQFSCGSFRSEKFLPTFPLKF